MTNIATVLKTEIARIVRKELRKETETLKKSNARYRSDIAELKRRMADLERQLKLVGRQGATMAAARKPEEGTAENLRFRAEGFRKLRERLGLSAQKIATLLGVSSQTIYNWESKTARPGKAQLAKIAELRKMGKRAIAQRLEAGGDTA